MQDRHFNMQEGAHIYTNGVCVCVCVSLECFAVPRRDELFVQCAVAQLVEALRYKPECHRFDSLEFLIDIILPTAL